MARCEQCGAELGGRSDARYCGGACRQAAYRDRRRNAVTTETVPDGPAGGGVTFTRPVTDTVTDRPAKRPVLLRVVLTYRQGGGFEARKGAGDV